MGSTEWAMAGFAAIFALVLLRDYIGGLIEVVFVLELAVVAGGFMFAITND